MEEALVNAPCGTVRGVRRDLTSAQGDPFHSFAFLGIPYAEAPVGERRFMAPVPRAHWDETRDASSYGATPQRHPYGEKTAIPEPSYPGEDTLLLNVFTPDPVESARHPVLVWVHGGGYVAGSPSSPWYDGAAFNRDGVVTVTVSYRLGIDGFGYIPESDAPLNRGVRDVMCALAWVQDNIAAFGGDPGSVTLAGQSAGGGMALALLSSRSSEGLFHRVIAQSPAVYLAGFEAAVVCGKEVREGLGSPSSLAQWQEIDEEEMWRVQSSLRGSEQISADPVVAVRTLLSRVRAGESLLGLPFAPTLDGDLFTHSLEDAIASGTGVDTPVLIGSTTNEFAAIGIAQRAHWSGDNASSVLHAAGIPRVFAWEYVHSHPELRGSASLVVGQVVSDVMFHVPIARWVQAREDAHPSEPTDIDAGVTCPAHKAGTWTYEFAWPRPSLGLADHCVDVPCAFDCPHDPYVGETYGGEIPRALSEAMHEDWVSFIYGNAPWILPNRRVYGARGDGGKTSVALRRSERSDIARLLRDQGE